MKIKNISIQEQQLVIDFQVPNTPDLKLVANSSKTTIKSKLIYTHDNNPLSVDEEQSAKFYTSFKKSSNEKYSRSKVKETLTQIISAFRCRDYTEKYFNGAKRITLQQGNKNAIYFKLSGKAKAFFEDIANSTGHPSNKTRQRLLFSLIETAFWQYAVPPLEKRIN